MILLLVKNELIYRRFYFEEKQSDLQSSIKLNRAQEKSKPVDFTGYYQKRVRLI